MKTKGRCFNLYAGPGVGKTTAMLSVVAELKHRGINVEMAAEYTKELIWHGMEFVQEDIFTIQATRLSIATKTDFIVTDSPLLQHLIYVEDDVLRKRIIDEYHQYENINIYLIRSEKIPYDPRGRYAEESIGRQTTAYLIDVLVARGWIAER